MSNSFTKRIAMLIGQEHGKEQDRHCPEDSDVCQEEDVYHTEADQVTAHVRKPLGRGFAMLFGKECNNDTHIAEE